MNVRLPDGRILKNVPEGTTKAQIAAKLGLKPEVTPEPYDPTSDMSGGQKFLAGAGKAFVDIGRGTKQLLGADNQEEINLSQERDRPLMDTGAGIGGNIAGGAAMFAPTAFIPGVNTYTGAALAGAGMGALQPVAEGGNRLANAAIGGMAGAAGKGIGDLIGRAVKPVASQLGPQEQVLAQAASKEGIPLTAGQMSGSRPLQITESVMENLPLTSGRQLAGREAQQRAFTAAALRRAGMEGGEATAEGMAAQKALLGGRLGEIAQKGSIDFNRGLVDDLSGLVDDAAQHLPPDAVAKISGAVDQVLSQVDDTGRMAGTNYQGWREPLRALSRKGDETASYFSRIRSLLDSAFRDQLEGAEGEAFRQTSRQYANLKTITDSMGGAGKLPAKGQISPAQLSAALSRSIGKEGKALGRGDLNELARIGQTFVSEQIPNSGTAQRQLIQALLTSGGGAGVGGAASMLTGGDFGEGAVAGGALAGGGLIAPRVIQSLMNSPAGQAYLTKGLVNLTPQMREALSQVLRLGTTGMVPMMTQ